MNRFEVMFQERGERFIPFLMLGDPDPEASERLALAAVAAGADALELGIPFSDPIADGPTIQRSAERARRNGATVDRCLQAVERLRSRVDVPIGLLLYYNLLHRGGLHNFAGRLASCGVDAVVVADVCLEESGEVQAALAERSLGLVHLVAPNTPIDRALTLVEHSSAFTYVLGLYGTTGARAGLAPGLMSRLAELRGRTAKPLVVGFGISEPDHARTLYAAGADGVIVGSALIQLLEMNLGNSSAQERALRDLVQSFTNRKETSTCSS